MAHPRERTAATIVLGLVLAACAGGTATPASSSPVASSVASEVPASPSAGASLDPAIAYAISQREQFGLRSDLAWVLAVAADPRARTRVLDFPMLPEEEAAFNGRQSAYDAVVTAVQQEAGRFPDVFGGVYIEQRAHTVVALWTDDPAPHRLAILAALGTAGPLQVRHVEYSEPVLRALQDRISADMDWMRDIGAKLIGVGVDTIGNRTSLTISSANPAAPALILAHYAVAAGMLQIDSDGTGIALLPRGKVTGRVRTADGAAPGPNALSLAWRPDEATGGGDCGGEVGLGVAPDGLFELPCSPGGWTIAVQVPGPGDTWVDVGTGHVVVPPGGTVSLEIRLQRGANIGP